MNRALLPRVAFMLTLGVAASVGEAEAQLTQEACLHNNILYTFPKETHVPFIPYNSETHHLRLERWARCRDCMNSFYMGEWQAYAVAHRWIGGVCAECGETLGGA